VVADWCHEQGYTLTRVLQRRFAMREIKIPDTFWTIPYNGAHYPGGPGVEGLKGGANCQQFAYELLRHNGFVIGNLRSSELWEDATDTVPVAGDLVPGDLLLFNHTRRPWGAHVAVYLGRDQAIHLARHIGKPAVWALSEFTAPLYVYFIGAKRPSRRSTK
jgi:hypothetical protein